jgi:hypothetical protein
VKKTRLERLFEDRDIATVEAIVAYLRSAAPRLVPTTEIARAVGRSTSQVYGLIKKGRELLSLTTGEFIPNTAKRKGKTLNGYTVTNEPRAAEFEAMKSFDRADGHLAQGVATHSRVPRAAMKTPEDLELWLVTQHRASAARFFLNASEEARAGASLKPNNDRLALASKSESATPWETLGLENHRADTDADDDIS